MPRPIALLTAQWADLPFTTVCELASKWGYDGLEIACWETTSTFIEPSTNRGTSRSGRRSWPRTT